MKKAGGRAQDAVLACLVFLVASVFAPLHSLELAAAVFALFFPVFGFFARGLTGEERSFALMFGGLYVIAAAVSAFVFLLVLRNPDQAIYVPFAYAAAFVAYLALKRVLVPPSVPARELAYGSGYAVVEVGATALGELPSGVYAARSKPVKKGAKVTLRFSRRLFSPARAEEVAPLLAAKQ